MAETWRWSIVALCWGVLVLVWIVGAVHAARRAPRKQVRSRSGLKGPLLVLVLVTWGVTMLFPVDRWPSLPDRYDWLTTVAAGLLPFCTGFAVWARITLGVMWTPTPAARAGHLLRTGGPYAVTRHPIYTGVLGMILCTALVSRHSWALALFAVAAVTLVVKIRAEEQVLGEVFGRDYDAYRARVPRIVPLAMLPGSSRQVR